MNKIPLTKSGKRILKNYQRQYGKEKGKDFFYATIQKYPERTREWHRSNIHGRRGLALASKPTRIRVARMGGKAR